MAKPIKFPIKDIFVNRSSSLEFLLVLPVILGMLHYFIFSLWLYWDRAPEIPLVLSTSILFLCFKRLEWFLPFRIEGHRIMPPSTLRKLVEIPLWYLATALLFWSLSRNFDFVAQLKANYVQVIGLGYLAVFLVAITLGTLTDYLFSFTSALLDRLSSVPMLVDRVVSIFLVYLSVAAVFAAIYRYMAIWTEGAFNQTIDSTLDAFYFSVVTMTTLGYGDIHPVSDAAKVFVMVQVLSGVMLLAMMVGAAISVSFYEIDHDDW